MTLGVTPASQSGNGAQPAGPHGDARLCASSVVDSAVIRATPDALFVNGIQVPEDQPVPLRVRSTGLSGTLRFARSEHGMTVIFDSKATGTVENRIAVDDTQYAVLHDGRFNMAPAELRLTLYENGKVSVETGNGRQELRQKERMFVGLGMLEFERCGGERILRYRHPEDQEEGQDPVQTVRIERSGHYEFRVVDDRMTTKTYGLVEYSMDGIRIDGRPAGLNQKIPFHCHGDGSLRVEDRAGTIFVSYLERGMKVGEFPIGTSENSSQALISYHSVPGLTLELIASGEPSVQPLSRDEAAKLRWCKTELV